MKIFLFIAMLSMVAPAPEWLTDFNKAKTEATQSNKMILLNFSGSDWCGPCIRMRKEIFGSDAFNTYAADHLVLLSADFPRLKKNQLSKEQTKQNESLADFYNKDGKFPFTVLMDTSGKIQKSWDGLPNESPEQFVNEVKKIIDASH